MEKSRIENVIIKIASARKKKGLSYENMAEELKITPPAYRKIETGETKLTVERLFRISELLDMPLTELLEVGNVFHQTVNESSVGYQQLGENFYLENKEIYEKLIKSKDEQIELLKSFIVKT